jgi:uncharacterized OsmC-like protein
VSLKWAGSSARLERSTDNRKVAGSNPARPIKTRHRYAIILVKIQFKKESSKVKRRSDELSESNLTKLKRIQGYKFRAEFDAEGLPDLIVDELKPLGESSGPNPTRLLSVAVGHCLSSSLLYCLAKARINVRNLETAVNATLERNEENYLRIKNLSVQMFLDVDEKDKIRVSRCLDVFENYCTVTQSVRKGIAVTVNVR